MLTSNCSFLGEPQEPFRRIADVAVVDVFELGVLNLPDFYFTGDDYRYHFEPEAKQRFLDSLREQFNSGVRYKGRTLKWDTVIEQKTIELSQYLVGRIAGLDFCEPSPSLHRVDDNELRKQILGLSQSEVEKLGIRRSTLWYIKQRARMPGQIRTYDKVRTRL